MCGGDPRMLQVRVLPGVLFPACAGVIPDNVYDYMMTLPFPRMCGGDPKGVIIGDIRPAFSPHVRG